MIGSSAPLFSLPYVWAFLWGFYLFLRKSFALIALLILSFFYGSWHCIKTIPQEEITAVFSPSSLQVHSSPFQKGLVYKGRLSTPDLEIPCSIYTRDANAVRPIANQSYLVQGQIEQRGAYDFVFKLHQFAPIENSWSLAEMRYKIKEGFKEFLSSHLSSKKCALFLSSVSTGDVEDRMLRYEFSRLGLQHILAISGFHFGILIAFCSFALRLFLSRFGEILCLFLMVNAYYLFVGSSPAVERSYLTALFYLLSRWCNRAPSGLNLLGCALGIELLGNPWVAGNMGFQYSFLSCAAILAFIPDFEKKLEKVLPNRTYFETKSFSLLSKHVVLAARFLRKSLSLTLAVNLVLFPILLFHFHKFPLLSFLYNLFFPFLVGVALFLLLASVIFYLLFPPVSQFLFWITDHFTGFLLDLTSYPPLALDISIQSNSVSSSEVIFYLFFLFLLKISIRENKNFSFQR